MVEFDYRMMTEGKMDRKMAVDAIMKIWKEKAGMEGCPDRKWAEIAIEAIYHDISNDDGGEDANCNEA